MNTDDAGQRHRLARLLHSPDISEDTWLEGELRELLDERLGSILDVEGYSHEPRETMEVSVRFVAWITAAIPQGESVAKVRADAKAARKIVRGDYPPPVATVVYYACLAVSLVETGSAETTLSEFDMKKGLAWCCSRTWISEDFKRFFNKALARLELTEQG